MQAFAQRRNAGEAIKIYVLSNFEKETLVIMQEIHADIFNLFDGIAISGILGVMKPDQQAFEKIISQFNLNPKDCLFIDDQKKHSSSSSCWYGCNSIFGINHQSNLERVFS